MEKYQPTIDRLLRRPEVEALTGLARATIYQRMATGHFPRPIKISKRAVAWERSMRKSATGGGLPLWEPWPV